MFGCSTTYFPTSVSGTVDGGAGSDFMALTLTATGFADGGEGTDSLQLNGGVI